MEKYWNMFNPSFDFNADEMMFDATAPVQFKSDDFNSEVIGLSFSIKHYLWFLFFCFFFGGGGVGGGIESMVN